MMFRSHAKYFIIFIIFRLLITDGVLWSHLSQQDSSSAPIASLNSANTEKLNLAIDEHENLLQKYPTNEFVPTVLFQLAQLYQRQATLLFQQEMEEYEKKLQAFDKGDLAQEPVLPRLNLQKCIVHLYRLATDYPHLPNRDKALYMLATAHLQEGNNGEAQIYFEQILQDFPDSPFNMESHFRVGESYFEKREYKQAILHYRFLLNQWNSPYFDMVLYKLGWSYYNLSEYTNAISTFIYLLDDIDLVERINSQNLSKSKADLSKEAIEYIASCYSEYGGAKAAKSFFANRSDKSYTLPVFLQLGALYQKRNYYAEATETYEELLSFFPYYEKAPEIYSRMVDNYEKDGRGEDANKVRESIVIKFGPGGDWVAQYPQGDDYRNAMNLARNCLHYLGTFYQTRAQKQGQTNDFALAIQKYQEYLEKFPFASDVPQIHYFLAECFYAQGDFDAAASAYYEVFDKYDTSQYRHDAAYNRILCYDHLLTTDEVQDSTTVYINEFLGINATLKVRVTHESEGKLLRACNDFVSIFCDSPLYDHVLMKFAETLHALRHYDDAVKVYKEVVNRGQDKPYYLTAALNTGQCYFDSGSFEQADAWFSFLAKNFPDSVRYTEKAISLANLAKFKIAESLNSTGKTAEAATVLQEVAKSTRDAQLRDRALYESANHFQKANKNTEAALSLEELTRSNSNSELADEALYKAAGLRESSEEWTLAAADYLQLSDHYPNSPYAMRALKNAALCYENLQDFFAAQNIYKRFVSQFPDSLNEVVECLCKSGEMAHKTGRFTEAGYYFQRTVMLYRQKQASSQYMDTYFVAQAQFMLGEYKFEDFKKLDLKPPFEKSLKKKVDKFNEVFQAYKETMEYQIADWSTAASYRIGMCFEEFVRAFIESPLPPGLAGEEAQRYGIRLAEAAKPYKERAMETYKKTIEQAEANKIENSWIAESRKRLQALMLDVGGPAEVKETPANGKEFTKEASNS